MDSDKKQNNNFKKFKRAIVFFVFFLPTVYILFQLFLILINQPYKTQTVIKYTIPDIVSAKTFIDMPQENINYNGGVLSYLIENGERVSPGNAIAEVFASEEQAQSKAYAQRLSSEAELLSVAQASTDGLNIETLMEQKLAKSYELIEKLDSGKYIGLSAIKSDLQLATNKLQIATNEANDFSIRMVNLMAEAAKAGEAAGASELIRAPRGGYFVSRDQSGAQGYTSEQLAAMTPLELKQAEQVNAIPDEPGVVGRIIYDYRWKCYLSVDFNQAKKFIEGKPIALTFPEISDMRIPAKIEQVQTDEQNATAKITISCDYMNNEIISLGGARAVVIFKDYEGLRIDKSALRIVNGQPGVYVKYGNIAEYRKIEILFEDENYILTPLSYEYGKNELKMYDEVIIGGRNIEDGKTM